MFTRIVCSFVLLGTAQLATANTLTESESDMSKCAGYVIAVERLYPKFAAGGSDVVQARIHQISDKNPKPELTYLTMVNTGTSNANIIYSYLKAKIAEGKSHEVYTLSEKAIPLCGKSGITLNFDNDKMNVSATDVGDAL